MHRRAITGLVLATSLGVALTGGVAAGSGPLPDGLREVRAALSRFHSLDQALTAGYDPTGEPCVQSPAGGMGVHAPNPGILGSGALDPLRPGILLYAPRDDGSLELVAAEWFAVALENTPDGPRPRFAATPPPGGWYSSAPSLFGQTFDGPMPGHNPSMPWHYDLHAWIFEANPAGIFAPFNPAISCT